MHYIYGVKWWKDLSIAKKLYGVIGAMALLIVGELATLNFAMGNLSAVRAFVGGEGLWSKAQKNALLSLQRFAAFRREEDFQAFLANMKIPEGDHRARIELSKANPNLALVREGFLAGHIDGDDIGPMTNLLRRFNREPHLARAIKAWTDADGLLAEMREAGLKYHALVRSPRPDEPALSRQMARVRQLNDDLTPIEEEFSNVLGEGSRWLERVLFSLLFAAVLTVETIGLTLTFLTSRSISRGLNSINAAALRFGRGEFDEKIAVDSSDEIGALAHSINEMAHALGLRDEFMSIASHELRSPLSALQMQLELFTLQADQIPDGGGKKLVMQTAEGLTRHARRLLILSEELMDLTQLRTGKFELRLERGDLAEIAHDVGAQLNPAAALVGSPISVQAAAPVVGHFDATRISQVITNLLSNAIKYGDRKPISLKVDSLGDRAVIAVEDRGIGIPTELQPKIFDRFERGSADKRIPGLGLGLYITQQIVNAHGGKIDVKSQPHAGTTFTVTLPISL